ncbi:TPA: helix-turn-helix domain-containing protein [Bacillus cereus]|uniref:helix-turn-helix domain-containing protein n=1 Tax=Bacillus cereus TaxID=1396 RepID=UPI001248397B|nr:helix-turn-helix domain-containing protein [Bacillus cereus]BCC15184.1 hypothetical protein BCM0074_p304 [Bacillus cereus]HDR6306407.1 hypothetical protein [Bacillus cereus]
MELTKELYTVKEVGEVLVQFGLVTRKGSNGYHTAHKLIQNGKIKSEMPGARSQGRRVTKEDLEQYLKKHAPSYSYFGEKSKREAGLEAEIAALQSQIQQMQENANATEPEVDEFDKILGEMPKNIKNKIYQHFESLYIDKIQEEKENTKSLLAKREELMNEISVLKEHNKKLEKGIKPLKEEDFYPLETETKVLHVNIFGERKKAQEFYEDLKAVKGYHIQFIEGSFKNKKREQQYTKLRITNEKKQVIHVPKAKKWETKYSAIEIIKVTSSKSHVSSEKNYEITFKYKHMGIDSVIFVYDFSWGEDWDENINRSESIYCRYNKDDFEMSNVTYEAFQNRLEHNEYTKKAVRDILERKLERIDDYKMLVPFIFTE